MRQLVPSTQKGDGRETWIRAREVAFFSWVYFKFRANRIIWPTECGGNQVEKCGFQEFWRNPFSSENGLAHWRRRYGEKQGGGEGWDWVILPPMEVKLMNRPLAHSFQDLVFQWENQDTQDIRTDYFWYIRTYSNKWTLTLKLLFISGSHAHLFQGCCQNVLGIPV